jgi:DNA polymerase-4
LFEDTEEKINLYNALDKIRLRFGENAIGKAVALRDKKDKTEHDT